MAGHGVGAALVSTVAAGVAAGVSAVTMPVTGRQELRERHGGAQVDELVQCQAAGFATDGQPVLAAPGQRARATGTTPGARTCTAIGRRCSSGPGRADRLCRYAADRRLVEAGHAGRRGRSTPAACPSRTSATAFAPRGRSPAPNS